MVRERNIFKLALLVSCLHSSLPQNAPRDPYLPQYVPPSIEPPPPPRVQSFGAPVYSTGAVGESPELPLPPSQFAAPSSPFTPVPGTGGTPVASLPYFERLLQDPFQWGPFRLYPSLNYGFSYSEGLQGSSFGNNITVRHSVTPAFVLESEHVTLSYSPSFTYYQKGRYGDSVNQNASIRTGFGYGDWNFGLSHSYSSGLQVLAETARETETTSHSSGLTAGYRMSQRTSLDFSLSRSQNDTTEFNSSTTYSSMNWFNYQITDITRLGLGGGGGFTEVQSGSDMTYQQIQARVNWVPRPKISASVNGGVELRQFLAADGANDRLNPIMGASASYRPFENTALTLSADRSVNTSVLTDQITENTSVSLNLSQRLVERVHAGLGVSLRSSDYQASSRFLQTDRSDTIKTFSASLGTTFFKKANVSVSYSYSDNSSTAPGFGYSGYSIGANIGYRF